MSSLSRKQQTQKRHRRLRRTLSGTASRPRLAVFRSNNHIYAQVISACGGKVLAAASTIEADVRKDIPNGGNVAAATTVGKLVAERARKAGVEQVAFDRSGFKYHGRIKALAEAARENGLKF